MRLGPRVTTLGACDTFLRVSQWFRTYGFADVADNLLVGAYPQDPADVRMLALMHVQRVLNLVEDDEYEPGGRAAVETALAEANIEELRLSLPDFGNLPPEALDAAVEVVSGWLDENLRCYVHCRAGWQRSAAIAAAVVATRKEIDVNEALEYVRTRKPSADPLPHQLEDLQRWWQARQPSSEVG